MFDITPQQFKSVIEGIVDSRIDKKGITKYISAIVTSVNLDNTANVYIPPDKDKTITRLINKTGEMLDVGDSVEICTKNGSLNNAWISVRHGIGTPAGGGGGEAHPIGSILLHSSDVIPDGWLLCDGTAISRLDYSDLFNVIGTTYGSGDGKNTFNLPDFRTRVPLGSNTSYILGSNGGNESNSYTPSGTVQGHALTVNEMPSHNHGFSSNADVRWDGLSGYADTNGAWATGYRFANNGGGGNVGHTGGNASHSHGFSGTRASISTLQPYLTVNYIIKVKPTPAVITKGTIIDNLESMSATDALSANQGRILNEKIEAIQPQEKIYWMGYQGTRIDLNQGASIQLKTMNMNNSSGITYSNGVWTIPEDGLYAIDLKIHLDNAPQGTRSFVNMNLSGAGIYCPTVVRSTDTQYMYGDPVYQLNGVFPLLGGTKIELWCYCSHANVRLKGGNFTPGDGTSTFSIIRIGEYL